MYTLKVQSEIDVICIKASQLFTKNFSYLVFDRDSKDGIIIDPAGDLDQIESLISGHRVNLSKVLLTHYHFDHVYLTNTLARKYNIQVLMNRIEIDYYGFNCRNLYAIDDSEPIFIGKCKVQSIHTPGHTKGSTCFLIGNNLFTGDTLFVEGCGLCFGDGADPNEMFDSLQQLKSQIDLPTFIYPGHSYGQHPGKTFDYLLQNNIYLRIDNRKYFISFRMRENQYHLFNFK